MRLVKSVNFEIVGKCNAKCSYCVTGNGGQTGTIVDINKFKSTMKSLEEKKMIDKNTPIELYNWGEPFLHPKIDEICEFMSEEGFNYAISSNLSVIPKKLTKHHLRGLKRFTVSMPGFSQASYDRIHGFKFETILSNIDQLANLIEADKINIAYHIYQFNICEIKNAQKYIKSKGMKIMSVYAFLNDYNLATRYLKNELTPVEYKRISSDLMLFYLDKQLEQMPENYRCSQYDSITIDENCNIIQCCGVPKNHQDYLLSSINDLDEDILENKKHKDICQECYSTRLVYWGNDIYNVANPLMYSLLK